MDLEVIANLIGSLGFPIVVCIMCFWYIAKLNTVHKEEVSKMTEAITNNTLAINSLIEKVGYKENV